MSVLQIWFSLSKVLIQNIWQLLLETSQTSGKRDRREWDSDLSKLGIGISSSVTRRFLGAGRWRGRSSSQKRWQLWGKNGSWVPQTFDQCWSLLIRDGRTKKGIVNGDTLTESLTIDQSVVEKQWWTGTLRVANWATPRRWISMVGRRPRRGILGEEGALWEDASGHHHSSCLGSGTATIRYYNLFGSLISTDS